MLDEVQSGRLFLDPAFVDVPVDRRGLTDIAFSGDGEPTTCKYFRECVQLVADLKRAAGLARIKIILITDACYLTKPDVAAALAVMDCNNGEIWAKLDAGTEAYYQLVNRPNYPLGHVLENIMAAARIRPIVIQSLFMRIDAQPPDEAELMAYVTRLNEIKAAGGKIKLVQVYTIARHPAESYVTALSMDDVDTITSLVRETTDLAAQSFYGPP